MSIWPLLVLVLMLAIALLSLVPGSSTVVSRCPEAIQKLGHLAFYAALGAAWVPTLGATLPGAAATAAAWLLATAFGAVMEGLQRYRPGRVGSWSDVLRNALGAAGGVVLVVAAWP